MFLMTLCLLLQIPTRKAFQPYTRKITPSRTALYAKKKTPKSSTAKGFGVKVEEPRVQDNSSQTTDEPKRGSTNPEFLQSIPEQLTEEEASQRVVDQSLSAEERAAKLLREKYGMKTLAEQQMSQKQLENYKEEQKRLKKLKKQVEMDQADLISLLPPSLVVGIDRFLKFGLVITGLLFVLAGIGITLEAWSKTTGNKLPSDLDIFIVQLVEPNFTYGLFVLLGFSVSLGIFAALQLGSEGANYREE